MGRKRTKIKATVVDNTEVVEEVFPSNGVVVEQHLDRDPNDPRNKPPKKALPSLDD